MVKRKVFTVPKCVMCGEIIEQKARGRPRMTCSDACKQARHRLRQGKPRKRLKRMGKLAKARRNLPFGERVFNQDFVEPVHILREKLWVYECIACGTHYIVDRATTGGVISPFCSQNCARKTRENWKRLEEALIKASMIRTIDPRVWERFDYKKLSPLCPRCRLPFAPNTTLFGQRRPGRPRKYCSDRCRKEAYEARWKHKNGSSRRHRYHECLECGIRFDRTNSLGRLRRKFCGETCADRFRSRAANARRWAVRNGRLHINGRRAAIMKSQKNKAKRTLRNEKSGEASGGEPQNGDFKAQKA